MTGGKSKKGRRNTSDRNDEGMIQIDGMILLSWQRWIS